MFTMTSGGALLLAANAATATQSTYTLSVQGIGTLPDGSTTNKSTATVTVTIDPSVGVYGSNIAVQSTAEPIDLTFVRFGGNLSAITAVNFTVQWDTATDSEIKHDGSFYNQLEADGEYSGYVVIPAGDPSTTMVLYAASGVSIVGVTSFSITVTGGNDTMGASYIPLNPRSSSLYGSTSATTVLRVEHLYVVGGVTAFASSNPVPALADTDSFGLGINPNDVHQGGLGDCYFMAALVLLAKNDPQAIKSLITDNGNGTFVVKLYTGIGTAQETFTFSGNFLSNGWNMAQLSGDYINNPGATKNGWVEIWPELLESAYAQLLMGGYREIVSGTVSNALIALTGKPQVAVSLAGFSNQDIGQLLLQAQNVGVPVAIGTFASGPGAPDSITLPSGAEVYFDHAYVLDTVNVVAGSVVSVTLINPWGLSLTGEGPANPNRNGTAIVVVPLADFSAAFGTMFFED